jgi:ABC-type glycerol-3-phosphate transport system permease component
MAAAVLLTVPLLVVCLCAQRYMLSGVRVTGASVQL